MDATIVNQVRAAPQKYTQKAEALLHDAELHLQQALMRYAKTSAQYCSKESKQEQARAIHRAVVNILSGRRVMFSDMVTLKCWLNCNVTK